MLVDGQHAVTDRGQPRSGAAALVLLGQCVPSLKRIPFGTVATGTDTACDRCPLLRREKALDIGLGVQQSHRRDRCHLLTEGGGGTSFHPQNAIVTATNVLAEGILSPAEILECGAAVFQLRARVPARGLHVRMDQDVGHPREIPAVLAH